MEQGKGKGEGGKRSKFQSLVGFKINWNNPIATARCGTQSFNP
ncbi:hypothetical protein BFG60_3044 [Microcystis aeruginosa NIES-98]|nr:hypothetical protein BFG60_3044 [Microcystis aeruginosa NIES-98]